MPESAIVCVDDEVAILQVIKEQFVRLFGREYIFETAQSAEEAWEVLNELDDENINVLIVISDWLMPNIPGDEFLAQVHTKFPKAIKIMLTGQADDEAIQRAEEQANLFTCIQKPWQERELEAVITAALKG
ncbi:response regulator [Acaryochloris sp. CCMEE 5410]|uniref:response regulator n=1 Tax=Acaryochloris sp. CCMEE 5410 TaxID=310037 RepID=UPI0002484AD9|nr:response regulator [Acaryochloris sp. CCMEE 5410]KAI9130320.1 response regulator [Acaryochloris sp. CCMEE 5410]